NLVSRKTALARVEVTPGIGFDPPSIEEGSGMFEKVAFTMYPVKDLARAEQFYRETLGLGASTGSVKSGWGEFGLPNGGCIALTVHSGAEPSGKAGGTIAFEVGDLDGLIAELKGKGVTFLATDIESPVCRMAMASDSEGNRMVLHQLKRKKT